MNRRRSPETDSNGPTGGGREPRHHPEPRDRGGLHRLAGLWFGLLLRAFPDSVLRRFELSMRETFDLRYQAARTRGLASTAAFLLRLSLDMAVSGAMARRGRQGHTAATGSRKASEKGTRLMFDHLKQDILYAVRSLRRSRRFAVPAVLTLALGVGITTSIFSVVNGVLLRPLPYPDQDRLVTVHAASVQNPTARGSMSGPDILDLQATSSLETLVGYTGGAATLTGKGEARVVPGARVTQGLLSSFGAAPFMGRDLRPEETVPGAQRAVVVGYGFWQEEMGGSSDVLGQTIQLQGDAYEIVGIAPPGFDFPNGSRLWRPYYRTDEDCGRGCHVYDAVGRLSDGATLGRAREEAEAVALRLDQAFPDSNFEKRFNVMSLEEDVVGDVRAQLLILLAAVGLVLLVACANVANLLLARAQGRMAEVGVRAALGAGRRRLLQQILTESLILALVGGGLGLGLAFLGVEALRGMAPASLPRVEDIAVDGTVLAFVLALSGAVAVVFGLSPALRLSRSSPAEALGRSRRGADSGYLGKRSRSVLLASEMALSLILLVGAGLLLRTMVQLRHVDPGYRTEQILRFTLSLPESAYPDLDQVTDFYERLESRLSALPGVAAVGSTFGAPLGSMSATGIAQVEGEPEAPPGQEIPAQMRPITPGYLETMGVPVLRGRGIEPSDRVGSEEVALVNQALADEIFPDEDPLGKRVRVSVDFGYGSPYRTIVGVVGNARTFSLTQAATGGLYVPVWQAGPPFLTMAVRTHPGAGSVLGAVRAEVARLDPELPLRGVETMEEVMAGETASTRFFLTLLAVFAGLAVVLAAVGLYGVASYMVSRRRQEIGIRMALGAQRARVTRLVLGQAAPPTILGVLVGLLVSLAGGRVLEGLLFEVDPRDPLVFAGVTAVLVSVAFVATLFPARQASRVDPGEVLRRE